MTLPPALEGFTASGPGPTVAVHADSERLALLRRFHLAGTGEFTRGLPELPEDLQPLAPTLRALEGAQRFPLLLDDLALPVTEAGLAASEGGEDAPEPLWAAFESALGGVPDPASNGTSLLRMHRDRFQATVDARLASRPGPLSLGEVFSEATATLREALDLDAEGAAALEQEVEQLTTKLGRERRVLGSGAATPLVLLLHAVERAHRTRRAALRRKIESTTELLRALLAVEHAKDATARAPEGLQHTVGAVGSDFLDTQQLASVLGEWRGGEPLTADQRRRVEETLAVLNAALQAPDPPSAIVVHEPDAVPAGVDFATLHAEEVVHEAPCAEALQQFTRRAAEAAVLFRGLRVARLLVDRAYEPERHDPWFERFDWEGFTVDELSHVPTVVVVGGAAALATTHVRDLAEVLLSGRPITVLALESRWSDTSSGGEAYLSRYRFDLGAFGLGLRKAFVQQTSATRPGHLRAGFTQALQRVRPALHVVATGWEAERSAATAWKHAEAARAGRVLPFFRYDPDAGSSWADRMDFTGNADPEDDWPRESVTVMPTPRSEEAEPPAAQTWEVPITFADYALLESALRSQFAPLPEPCGHEDLVRLDAYLQLPADEAVHKLPWIWAVNGEGALLRLLLTRRLALVCRDRLDDWHALQELAGIHNRYVEDAVARTRAEDEAEMQALRERLESEHAAALERIERESVQKAMRRLARMLLDLDPLAPAPGAPANAMPETIAPATGAAAAPSPEAAPDTMEGSESMTAPAAPPAEASAAIAPEAEEEDEGFDEPWIDSALCTSCNDCIQLNSKLFVYDENKQARIGDPRAGTYAQLVQAAEKCPAHCIHPGKPLNPDEPNLDVLIQKAARFN